MANIQPWGLGRHVPTLIVTMQTVTATTGALAPSAVVANLITSTGVLHTDLVHTSNLSDDIEWEMRRNTETVQGITRNRLNHLPTTHGGTFNLVEILRRGNDECRLAACWFEGPSDVATITYGRFGNLWVVYTRLVNYREGPYARGKNIGTATFEMIDANVAPAFTAADR